MIFQREKKELWRYASENHAVATDATNSQLPQPHHLQHQRLPQHWTHQRPYQPSSVHPHRLAMGHNNHHQQSEEDCCNSMRNAVNCDQQVNIPPPPYSSVPYGIDCSGLSTIHTNCHLFRQQPQYATDSETSTEVDLGYGVTSELDFNQNGCNYENCGDGMLVDGYEQSNDISASSCLSAATKHVRRPSTQPSTPTIAASTIALFRNCFFTESTAGTTMNNNNNHNGKTCFEQRTSKQPPQPVPRQYFDALMKPLKPAQIKKLLEEVKCRFDSSVPRGGAAAAAHQSYCILIPRAPILHEEPYVIACRLFLWRDLKDASELKRLPVCPNERDPVYVCCNPLHWCRILETDTAPPPYQRRVMERLKAEGEYSQNEGSSITSTGSSVSTTSQMQPGLRVRIPDSLPTDGEGRRTDSWCRVAYWERSQRVGALYLAQKSSINIYSDGGGISEGMCLRDLAAKKSTPPRDVQSTRQKIGLGVTLSQEADGVWLYNRSKESVFVHSHTLSESLFRVCRVLPGECLKAFDSHRAQYLIYPSQFPGAQTGPVDTFSMRISFAKGWGDTYKRQDIISCPCWLEIMFTQR